MARTRARCGLFALRRGRGVERDDAEVLSGCRARTVSFVVHRQKLRFEHPNLAAHTNARTIAVVRQRGLTPERILHSRNTAGLGTKEQRLRSIDSAAGSPFRTRCKT